MDIRKEFIQLMTGEYDFDRIYDWATQLMNRKLTQEEILGFVLAVKELTVPLSSEDMDLSKTIDISGTGGDQIKTINVSTISSFVLASAGLIVGKQSTRGYTSLLGSRNLLSELGIELPQGSNASKICEDLLKKHSLAFYYHPAFSDKFQNQIKFFTELKEKNLLFTSPWHLFFWIYNPLPLAFRVYGMFTDQYLTQVGQTLASLGIKRGLVVNGVDGLDEISNIGITKIVEFQDNQIKSYELSPEDFGIKPVPKESIIIKDRQESILIAVRLLFGKEQSPKEDLVAMNAGAGLYIAGLSKDFKQGNQLAKEIIRSGAAGRKLEEYVQAVGDFEKLKILKNQAGIN